MYNLEVSVFVRYLHMESSDCEHACVLNAIRV